MSNALAPALAPTNVAFQGHLVISDANRELLAAVTREKNLGDRFGRWLFFAQVRLIRRGQNLNTVADPAWEVLYEGGVNPREAADLAIAEHHINSAA